MSASITIPSNDATGNSKPFLFSVPLSYRLIIIGLATASFLVNCWLGRFAYIDEMFFKAPGKHWAESGHFVAPELAGFLNVSPPLDEVFFVYTPLYSFLFGIWVKMFGFGWQQCISYDALIHAILIVLVFELAVSIARFTQAKLRLSLPQWLPVVIAIAFSPLTQPARPDELGMCFGFVGLCFLLLDFRKIAPVLFSGLFFGLCAATSPGAALTLGFTAFFLVFLLRRPLVKAFLYGCAWLLIVALVIGVTILPIVFNHHAAYKQFLTAADFIATKSVIEASISGWGHYRHRVYPLIGGIIFAFLGARLCWRHGLWRWHACLWVGSVIAIPYIVFSLPGEFNYFWFYTPWLLIAASVSFFVFLNMGCRSIAYVGGVTGALLFIPAYAHAAIQLLSLIWSSPTQSLIYNENLIARTIPNGCTVLTTYAWWFLKDKCRTLDPIISRYGNLNEIDFVILSPIGGGGTGQYQWKNLGSSYQKLITEQFHPIVNNLPEQPLRLFGIRLTNTTWGHGMIIFARNTTPEHKPAENDEQRRNTR